MTISIKRMYKSLYHFRYDVSLLYHRTIKKAVDLQDLILWINIFDITKKQIQELYTIEYLI
jgi:hypothetical protein